MRVVIIGRPNVGKSLLLINFAAYLGAVEAEFEASGHAVEKITLDRARREWVSYVPHRNPLPLRVKISTGKSGQTLLLFDGTGITDGIHTDFSTRHAMADTLEHVFEAEMILYVLDASAPVVSALDDALVGLSAAVAPLLIVDTKADLQPETKSTGHRQHFSQYTVLTLSSVTRQGFRELKQRLLGYLEDSRTD